MLLRDSARDGRKGDKFQSRYLGPYEIIEELGKGVFRLRNPSTGLLLKKSVNACRLKPYRKKKQQSPLHLTNSSLFQVRNFIWYKITIVDLVYECKQTPGFFPYLYSDWIP